LDQRDSRQVAGCSVGFFDSGLLFFSVGMGYDKYSDFYIITSVIFPHGIFHGGEVL
jgi:hypothetical protein